MAAKPKRTTSQAAVAVSTTAVVAVIATGSVAGRGSLKVKATPSPARFDTNPANATKPALSSSTAPNSTILFYEERPGPMSTTGTAGDPDHRPNQPFQGAAPLRPVSQSPNLNSSQSHQQQQYQVHGVFSPQGGLQSPYLNNPQSFPPHQQPNEGTYYTSNPSPRSTTSAAYYPSDKHEPMATATTAMQRPYSQIYHTPQSNSPVSVTSPQTHDHGRPMYPQQPSQMQPPMYGYPNYPPMAPVHSSAYTTHHQPPQMSTQPMIPYPSNPNSISQGNMSSQSSTIQSSPRIKSESSQHYTPQSQAGILPQQRHSTTSAPAKFENTPLPSGQPPAPPTTSNAAPGPIPATTPLVVRQDNNGVQWIAFEYSRDRVKMEYTIRCDVESVDASQLSQEFKGENCVYPRACVPKDQYKGNRLAYETDCNQVGWALAQLNPCLRGKRGLIQRAVDSWRNSNQDPRLRSRRVRRQAKMQNRSKVGALTSQGPGPNVSSAAGHPGPGSMNVPVSRPPGNISTSSQQGIHQSQHDVSSAEQESVLVGVQYPNPQVIHRPASTHMTSPNEIRHAQTFPGYPTYPSAPTTHGPMPPSMPGTMHGYGRAGGNATMASRSVHNDQDEIDLYGNLPEAKRRKFIQVDDTQKGARVRVKVTLDQVDLSEIPDSYRKQNSIFPRAYFPTQMHSTVESQFASRFNDDDVEEADDVPPTIGRTTVPCRLTEGDAEVEVSQISRHKKDRERKLNELGYRMAWSQSRIFANRPIFLGRALDIYRNKQRNLLSEDPNLGPIPPHLETRPGKRRWQERTRPISAGPSPTVSGSS